MLLTAQKSSSNKNKLGSTHTHCRLSTNAAFVAVTLNIDRNQLP